MPVEEVKKLTKRDVNDFANRIRNYLGSPTGQIAGETIGSLEFVFAGGHTLVQWNGTSYQLAEIMEAYCPECYNQLFPSRIMCCSNCGFKRPHADYEDELLDQEVKI